MQSNYQHRFLGKSRVRATTISAYHQSNRIVVTIAYALMSGIIVLWIAHLAFVTGSILNKLNIMSDDDVTFSSTVNHQHKGDRVPAVTFDDRWNALGKFNMLRPTATIPSPCQLGAECGVRTKLHTKLAVAEWS